MGVSPLAGTVALLAIGCGRVGFDGDRGADAPALDGAQLDAPATDFCATVPALASDPTIDGVVEASLTPRAVTPIWSGAGSSALPTGVSASYAIGWRPDGLYFFVDVTDPDRFPTPAGAPAFCGDAVELYVDSNGSYPAAPGYDNPGAAQLIAEAPPTGTETVATGVIYRDRALVGTWPAAAFGAYPRAGGYVVEAEIFAQDLGLASWALAGHVGFDLAIDVSTPDGSPGPASDCPADGVRLGQIFLQVAAPTDPCGDGGPYCDVRAFCTPALQ